MLNASRATRSRKRSKPKKNNFLFRSALIHLRHETYAEQYVNSVTKSIPAKAFRLLDAASVQRHLRIIMDAAAQHGMPTQYGR